MTSNWWSPGLYPSRPGNTTTTPELRSRDVLISSPSLRSREVLGAPPPSSTWPRSRDVHRGGFQGLHNSSAASDMSASPPYAAAAPHRIVPATPTFGWDATKWSSERSSDAPVSPRTPRSPGSRRPYMSKFDITEISEKTPKDAVAGAFDFLAHNELQGPDALGLGLLPENTKDLGVKFGDRWKKVQAFQHRRSDGRASSRSKSPNSRLGDDSPGRNLWLFDVLETARSRKTQVDRHEEMLDYRIRRLETKVRQMAEQKTIGYETTETTLAELQTYKKVLPQPGMPFTHSFAPSRDSTGSFVYKVIPDEGPLIRPREEDAWSYLPPLTSESLYMDSVQGED